MSDGELCTLATPETCLLAGDPAHGARLAKGAGMPSALPSRAYLLGAALLAGCAPAVDGETLPDGETGAPSPADGGTRTRDAGSASHDGAAPGDASASDPAACTTDDDCHHGTAGAGTVCATSGAEAGQCIAGCHGDADCPAGQRCDTTATPHWSCEPARDDAGAPGGCPVLAYPSGVHLETVTDAAMTATYKDHLAPGQVAPACFVDTDRLVDPVRGTTVDLAVKLSAHFTLEELVGSEVARYGHRVLVSPAAVLALEGFAQRVGVSVSVNSGFRGPRHQEDTCAGLCGNPLGCPGTCANASRHMWGDAFDLPLAFYTKADEDRACAAGFKFAYLESGTHLHVDQNPAYATCVEQ